MKHKISLISRKIAECGKTVFFTGAGISTESGIPDYRSKGGLWDKFKPVYFDDFISSKKARIEYWKRKTALYQDLIQAKPNPAHIAIAELHKMGLLEAVITQNIDGLHQESGLPDQKVVELHGNTRRVRCLSCYKLFSEDEVQQRIESGDLAPECQCGGYLKPDTISFGQAMPVEAVEKAVEISGNCDLFIVVGSTLIVHPAAQMPYYAKENGAFLVVLNLSETPCDKMCDVLIRGKAGEVLQRILNEIIKLNGGEGPSF